MITMNELIPKRTPFGHGWSISIYLSIYLPNAFTTDTALGRCHETVIRVTHFSFQKGISYFAYVKDHFHNLRFFGILEQDELGTTLGNHQEVI